ncbi:MAG: methylenetetrahydrofolate--tRNA-(uracil(54)-C(5))-methyltransferase (FADH(2)-oxidizing) TrmFO [Deltaproteobacteria bacterium]
MTSNASTIIIGGGLAGCEAAWQLLQRGQRVALYEMKPLTFSAAHKSTLLAELVCSNSLRSNSPDNAVGLLKEELRRLGSLIMAAADANAVPAGSALAVDRLAFSHTIEEKLLSHGSLEIIRGELRELPPERPVIIATGPLTSPGLARNLAQWTGGTELYFYDAISPIIDGESIDYDKVFRASRYDTGEGDYLNCPLEKDEYEHFWRLLIEGEETPLHTCEELKFFEGCMPIEVMAKRGISTLAFGPMKPVGLVNPHTGKQPSAVVQLRRENLAATLYNLVGFQTKLTWPEQRRIFRTIPGLAEAEFVRYGSIHRNTFINSPVLLTNDLELRAHAGIFFAGQITGVEGYVESTAMGLLAGLSAYRHSLGSSLPPPPETTAIGALVNYITKADKKTFQPMNVNFGIFPPLATKTPKKLRGSHYSARALTDLDEWITEESMVNDPPSSAGVLPER